MAELPSTARVVIIGGGAVGVSSLYHLAKAGWTDCVLLEKNELTSGSTWHAAGNVPTFSSSWSLMNMQRYSAELYRGLAEAVDYPMNYHVTGSLRLAHSDERMREFQRVKGMGRYQGMDIDVVGLDEIRARYPVHRDARPQGRALRSERRRHRSGAAHAGAGQGRARHGREDRPLLPGHRRAPRQRRMDRRRRRKARSAANMWSTPPATAPREVGKMFGRDVPMMVMSHQYILFEEIPELAAWSKANGQQAAAAARRRHLLLPAAGKERHESRPLRAQLPRALGRPQRSDAGRFLLPALPRRSGAAGALSQRRHRAACRSSARPGCPRSSTARSPMRRTATR